MIFQHKDGTLRIIEHGNAGTTYHVEVRFIDANLTGPIARPQTEERLVLNRSQLDSNAHYVEGGDASRLEPLSLTFSCKAADTSHTQFLIDILSGASVCAVGASTYKMHSRKGKEASTNIYGLSTALPNFADTNYKCCYMVEVLYSGTSNWGVRWDQTYFPPAEQTITESEDALTLNLNGQIYGGVTTITSHTASTTGIG